MKVAVGIINLKHEKNTISIIRTAEHFGVRRVFVIGDKILNGSSCKNCHKHMIVKIFKTEKDFVNYIQTEKYKLVLMEKSPCSINICKYDFPDDIVIMSGHELKGFSDYLLSNADGIIHIPNVGLVNCMNTAAAFSIGIYKYFEQKVLR